MKRAREDDAAAKASGGADAAAVVAAAGLVGASAPASPAAGLVAGAPSSTVSAPAAVIAAVVQEEVQDGVMAPVANLSQAAVVNQDKDYYDNDDELDIAKAIRENEEFQEEVSGEEEEVECSASSHTLFHSTVHRVCSKRRLIRSGPST